MEEIRYYLCLLRKEEKPNKEKGFMEKKKEIGKTAIREETAILFDFTTNIIDVFLVMFVQIIVILGAKSEEMFQLNYKQFSNNIYAIN